MAIKKGRAALSFLKPNGITSILYIISRGDRPSERGSREIIQSHISYSVIKYIKRDKILLINQDRIETVEG